MSETNGTGQTPQTENKRRPKLQAYVAEFFGAARIGRGLAGFSRHKFQSSGRADSDRNGAVKDAT